MTIYALGDRFPEIEVSAWVAPDANVIGAVHLGPRASVWFGATLRGDNEPIGDETLIGMGATVLNGARIGRNCPIGAGSLVPRGRLSPTARSSWACLRRWSANSTRRPSPVFMPRRSTTRSTRRTSAGS